MSITKGDIMTTRELKLGVGAGTLMELRKAIKQKEDTIIEHTRDIHHSAMEVETFLKNSNEFGVSVEDIDLLRRVLGSIMKDASSIHRHICGY